MNGVNFHSREKASAKQFAKAAKTVVSSNSIQLANHKPING
jgi:hypothetical protein